MKNTLPFLSPGKALGALAGGLFLFALAPQVRAQGYSTTFDSFLSGYTVSDQFGWVTNDEYSGSSYNGRDIGQSDGIGKTGYSSSASDFEALLGGDYNVSGGSVPGHPIVTLTHAANLSGAATTATFGSDFVVTAPDAAGPNHDAFGFIFQNSSAASLFSVNLGKTTTNSTTSDDVSVTSSTGTSGGLASVSLGYRYRLSISMNIVPGFGGTFSVAIQPETFVGVLTGTSVTLVTNATFTGTIANIGTSWTLSDTTDTAAGTPVTTNGTAYNGGGDNTLLFDNFGFVPEPSEYAMFGLGVATLLMALRRRASCSLL